MHLTAEQLEIPGVAFPCAPAYQEVEAPSGLRHCRSVGVSPPISWIASILTREVPVVAVVQFGLAELEEAPELEAAEPVFEGVGPHAKPHSPCLVDAARTESLPSFVERLWDRDAAVVLLTADPLEAVCMSLRRVALEPKGVPKSRRPQPLAIAFPSVMRPTLATNEGALARDLVGPFAGWLVEAEAPRGWELFLDPERGPDLEALGFERIPNEDDESA